MFGVQSLPCSNAVRELEFSSLQFMCCEQAFRMRSVIVIFKGEVSGEQKCPGGQMDVRGGQMSYICSSRRGGGGSSVSINNLPSTKQVTCAVVPGIWRRQWRRSRCKRRRLYMQRPSTLQPSGLRHVRLQHNSIQPDLDPTQPTDLHRKPSLLCWKSGARSCPWVHFVWPDPTQPTTSGKIWTQRDPTQYN